MKHITELVAIVFIAILLSFSFENDSLQKIVDQIENYYREYPEEKAFIQTDKPFYMVGETIWFKAYLVEGISNKPDSVSVPLYVELLNPSNGTLLQRHIIKLAGGFGHGDFELAESLPAGLYRIRAYTNWMRNFKEELFFTKDIKVFTHAEIPSQTVNEDDIDMQFFPEGGTIVEEVENRIAFKVVDAAGRSVDIAGKLVSSSGDTVARFKSDHIGTGAFKIKPQSGKSYKAIITFKNIYSQSFDLPASLKQGITMTVDNVSSKAQIRIALNNTLSATGMLIVGQARGVVYYTSFVPAGIPNAFVTIAKEKFPAGIAQFTIFDESLKPRCERIVFIPDQNQLYIHLTPDKTEYTTREKSEINIQVKNQDGSPVKGNFTMNVLDESQIKNFSDVETLPFYLLINSDIKGHIENPSYYFDKTNKYAALHLDLLLMTQGWRRFTWDQVLQEKLPAPRHFIEKGLIIAGNATKLNGRPIDKTTNLTLMIGRDTNQQFLMNTVNPDGSFLFYGLDFKDSTQILAQLMKSENNQRSAISLIPQTFAHIDIVQGMPGIRPIESDHFSDYILHTRQALEYERQLKLNDAIWLSEMTVQAKRRQKVPEGPRVLYSNPDDVIRGDVSLSALNIFDLIRGRVAGVQITGDRSDPTIVIRSLSSISLGAAPLYLIDGSPVSKQTVLALNINSVDRVEVIKNMARTVMYGDQARGGIVSVFLKSGNEIPVTREENESRENASGMYLGYYTQKQFYSPKYTSAATALSIPDYRTTIHWAANVLTDADGKAKVEYYNTDAISTIRVYVEGLSYDGKMGVSTLQYQVKK